MDQVDLIISKVGGEVFYYGSGLLTGLSLFGFIKLVLLLVNRKPVVVEKIVEPHWSENPQ